MKKRTNATALRTVNQQKILFPAMMPGKQGINKNTHKKTLVKGSEGESQVKQLFRW